MLLFRRLIADLSDELVRTILIYTLYGAELRKPAPALAPVKHFIVSRQVVPAKTSHSQAAELHLMKAISRLIFVNRRLFRLVPTVLNQNLIGILLQALPVQQAAAGDPVYDLKSELHLRRYHPRDSLVLFFTRCPTLNFAPFVAEVPHFISISSGTLRMSTSKISLYALHKIVEKCEEQIRNFFDFFLHFDEHQHLVFPSLSPNENVGDYETRVTSFYKCVDMVKHLNPVSLRFSPTYVPYVDEELIPEEVASRTILRADSSLFRDHLQLYLNSLSDQLRKTFYLNAQAMCMCMLNSVGYAQRCDLIEYFVRRSVELNKDPRTLFKGAKVELASSLLAYTLVYKKYDLFHFIESSWSIDSMAPAVNWSLLLAPLVCNNNEELLFRLLDRLNAFSDVPPVDNVLATCFSCQNLSLLFSLATHPKIQFDLNPFLYYYRDTEDESESAALFDFIYGKLRELNSQSLKETRIVDPDDESELGISPSREEFQKIAAIFISILLQKQKLTILNKFIQENYFYFFNDLPILYLLKCIPFCSILSLDYLLRNIYFHSVLRRIVERPPDNSAYGQRFYYRTSPRDDISYADETANGRRESFFRHYHEVYNPQTLLLDYEDERPVRELDFNATIVPTNTSPIPYLPYSKFQSIAVLFLYCTSIEQINVVMYYIGRFYQQNVRRLVLSLFTEFVRLPQCLNYHDHFKGYSAETELSTERLTSTVSILLEYFKAYLDETTKANIVTILFLKSDDAVVKFVLSHPLLNSIALRKAVARNVFIILQKTRDLFRAMGEKMLLLIEHPEFSISSFDSTALPIDSEMKRHLVLVDPVSMSSISLLSTADQLLLKGSMDLLLQNYILEYNHYLCHYHGTSLFVKALIYCRLFQVLRKLLPDIPIYVPAS